MARETKKRSKEEAKKYKFDYRKDGKLDITFIRLRLSVKRKDLSNYVNTNKATHLWSNKFNNPKKTWYNFTDFSSVDSSENVYWKQNLSRARIR